MQRVKNRRHVRFVPASLDHQVDKPITVDVPNGCDGPSEVTVLTENWSAVLVAGNSPRRFSGAVRIQQNDVDRAAVNVIIAVGTWRADSDVGYSVTIEIAERGHRPSKIAAVHQSWTASDAITNLRRVL